MNLCTACDKDFTSLEGFDAHRVGVHEYTYSQGVAMTPIREDGRRCLSTAELTAKGYVVNDRGSWFSPARAARARNHFTPTALSLVD